MGQVLQALLLFLAGWSLSQYRYLLQSKSHLEQSKSQVQEWMLQLNHHSDLVVEKETQLAQAHSALEKAMLRQSELEMALDLAHSKAMVQQKALDWDLQ
jgi:DNA-binding transcriptional MerR regulator